MLRVFAVMTAAAAVLTGCGLSRVVSSERMSAYPQLDALYAFNDRDAQVEVFGLPFGGDAAAFQRRVTDAMQHRAMGVNTRFTTTPNDTARPGYRIAVIFNPVGYGPSGRVCRTPTPAVEPPQAGPPYKLYVEAAFCRDGGDFTAARGWLDAATGPDDPNFRHLVGDLTGALFPRGESDSCGGPDC
jgi:hypothetical protein